MRSKYHREDCRMSLERKTTRTLDADITTSEILFGTLLGIGSICFIWVATTLLIHLYKNLH
jgi:hypothetical protein